HHHRSRSDACGNRRHRRRRAVRTARICHGRSDRIQGRLRRCRGQCISHGAGMMNAQPSIAFPNIGPTRLLIDGEWLEGAAEPMETFDPATGVCIAKVSVAAAGDVDRAVRAARLALEQGPWRRVDAADRGRLLFRLADLVEAEREALAALESYNCGMKIGDARDVVSLVLDSLRYYAGWADKIEGS